MSQFRSKILDLGCFIKTRTIRDHTKRKVFEQFEPERYIIHSAASIRTLSYTNSLEYSTIHDTIGRETDYVIDKHSVMSSAIPYSHNVCARRRN